MQLKANHLFKSFGKRVVVNDVSLDVAQGEIVGLLGPNGAGKTTSFYMMVGLIRTTQGNVFLGSEEITHYPIHKRAQRGIGYLPQEASIFRELSVQENIFAALENKGLSRAQRHQRLNELLHDFGLEHVKKTKGGHRHTPKVEARASPPTPLQHSGTFCD